jgi:hypothetical protein
LSARMSANASDLTSQSLELSLRRTFDMSDAPKMLAEF